MRIEILAYNELSNRDALLPLMEQAFGWPFDPTQFEKSIRIDPRLRNGSVGFCALRDGLVVGYVGVMDFVLRNAQGSDERVGGLYGVATHPEYTRRGICTELMNHAHEYFKARGYRFSLLTTSPTIVAHALYEKLGYHNVAPFRSAYLKTPAEKSSASKCKGASKFDYDRMLELFREYVKDKTGFVIRDKTYMEMLVKQYRISSKDCITTENGYVIFKKETESVRIRELVAQSMGGMSRLIGLVESKARKPVVGRLGIGNVTLGQAFASRGFTVLKAGHSILMAKDLATEVSFDECFGNAFFMSPLDHF